MSIGRILIVEDDGAMLRGLKDLFASKGWDVITAEDGQKGLDAALSTSADVIVLDLMLPFVNGYEICRAVRERGIEAPILMLTAKGREEDIVLGLNLGADDYITKPFRRNELIARVNAFMRRRQSKRQTAHRFGAFELNLSAHKLLRAGQEVDLTAKEFALLSYLVERRGCALARDHILNAVWGNSVMVTGRSVDRCVATLRSKLEQDPHQPIWIQTVRDVGYRFESESSLLCD